MTNCVLNRFEETKVQFIDGDRGVNYPKKSDLIPEGYCVFLNTGNVTSSGFAFDSIDYITEERDQKLRKGKATRNDIILTTRGTVGNVSFYDSSIPHNNIRINSGMVLVRTDIEEYLPYFLYLFFRSELFKKQCLTNGSGSAQPQLPISAIKNISIPKVHVELQKKIVDVIQHIDHKIALNNKINIELEAMAKLIYNYWFVQFDFPDVNGKPYKSSGGKMVYNEDLNRETPNGWVVCKVGEALNTDLGGTPSTKVKEYWTGDIPWLNSGEIANFPIIEAEEHINSNAIKNSATSLMPKGTCALSITRHLRPTILAVDACANQSVVGIYENEEFKSSFIYPYLVNEIPRLMSLRTGAQQPHINKGIVDASPITLPPKSCLNAYYEKVNSIYDQINNLAFQNKELTELRDWLLPMLMNGQVTVKDA